MTDDLLVVALFIVGIASFGIAATVGLCLVLTRKT